MTENNNIEEDAYFIYRIITYKKKYCELRINRTDYRAFIIKDLSVFMCIIFLYFRFILLLHLLEQ